MDRFLIAPFNSGLQTDLKPWQIPDEAFEQLSNAYIFRGRVRKRFGSYLTGTGWPSETLSQLYSRLRVALLGAGVGITDAAGNAAGTVPGRIFKVGQMFSIGTEIFTVTTAGVAQNMINTGGATGATYSTTNGAYTFTGATPLTQIYFYPSEPVMGLTRYEYGAINNQPAIAFDTQFCYRFTGSYWINFPIAAPYFHGVDTDFFWATNWTGIASNNTVIFATNYRVVNKNGAIDATDDSIWTYDGTTWAAFTPRFKVAGAGNTVQTARIIVPFKNRLLLLGTIERDAANANNLSYPNRCRYSRNGSPFPANTDAWLEINEVGYKGAGWIDAPTEEEIISAGFIKDRLIVYFERSTWEIVYTGNQVIPFVWQKISTELGSESTLSSVVFDKVLLTIGNTGVHSCTGGNVMRIDSKIPDQIFEIKDKYDGVSRIAGIRDFYTEMVYWTFPSGNENVLEKYPNKVLVYNYANNSWAFNNDCITAFGYFEQQSDDTWENETDTWEEDYSAWNSGVMQAQFRQIIAGNQQGFVFIIAPTYTRNAANMQITKMALGAISGDIELTIIDHTLAIGEFINVEYTASLQGIFKIADILDKDTVVIQYTPAVTLPYTGGGTASRVSNIEIKTKQWNPYGDKGRNFHLAKVDFNVEKTSAGQITVDYLPSFTDLSMLTASFNTDTSSGTNILETSPYNPIYNSMEQYQKQLWHPLFFHSDGQVTQLYFYLSDDQMMDLDIAYAPFELHGMILYTQPTSSRL